MPSISVVLKVYDGEKYIAESIRSVLAQTWTDYELIVIDDGSTDDTASIVHGFDGGLTYVFQENAGIGSAMNHGINLAVGDFIAFQDADDLWVPEKLELQMRVMLGDDRPDLVFGHLIQFISPELDDYRRAALHCPPDPLPGYFAQAMLARRTVFERAGLFDGDWQVGEFIDWYLRASELGLHIVMLPDVVVKRRLHESNQGIRKKDSRVDYARILKSSLDRRRAQKRQNE